MRNGGIVAAGLTALALAGCGPKGEQGVGAPNGDILSNSLTPPAVQPAPPAPPAAPPQADAWIGRWTGPEGLFLQIGRDPAGAGAYRLTIKADLDSKGDSYAGKADGDAIRFDRAGKTETIHPGIGAETGFKWLADKKDCLIVVAGKEGYCRD